MFNFENVFQQIKLRLNATFSVRIITSDYYRSATKIMPGARLILMKVPLIRNKIHTILKYLNYQELLEVEKFIWLVLSVSCYTFGNFERLDSAEKTTQKFTP
jgi:hypothetical protein